MARSARTSPTETVDVAGIRVEITRKNVRNLNLRVRKDGTVAVSVRPGVETERIVQFVESKRAWIEGARERVAQKQKAREMRCFEGSELQIWGRTLTCHIEPLSGAVNRAVCEFEPQGERLIVRCGDLLVGDDEATSLLRDRMLANWLTSVIRTIAVPLMQECEDLVGKRCSTIRFRRMTSRWGSCNVNTAAITLNTELVHYPPSCLRYVIIHELCHLYEPNHGERFHRLMDHYCPGWQRQRAILEARDL